MILASYAAFREVFGEPDTTTATSVTGGTETTITLAAASDAEVGDLMFVDMGDPAQELVVITEVVSTTEVTANFSNSHSGTTSIRVLSKDGYRKWRRSKIRAGGFSGTLVAPTPATLTSLTPITSSFDVYEGNGGTAGLPVHTWYLSQPGSFLSATEKVGSNKTITISFTSDAQDRFNGGAAFTTPPDPEEVLRPLLRHCYVYVKDSSGNIQWVDLERSAFADG